MTLREAIQAAGRPLRGTFVLSGSSIFAELAARAGFDFVVVDCEHSPLSPFGDRVADCIRAVQAAGAIALVRVPGDLPAAIGKVLDAGADGVIVAHTDGEQAAARAISAAHYPPRGTRGAAPVVRGAGYGVNGWRAAFANEPTAGLVIPLIEDPSAVDAIERICAFDEVDAVMLGAFDLSVALGRPTGERGDVEIEAARDRVYAAAAASGVAVGDYAWDVDSARRMADAGASWVAIGNDVGMLATAMRAAAGDG